MFRQNIWFFTAFFSFLLIVGVILLWTNHGDAIFFFSERRSYFGDLFFYYFTKMGEEHVYVFTLLFFLFVRFKYALMVPLLGLVVTIVSFSSKAYFAQPRPGLYFEMLEVLDTINLIEGVALNTGNSSFPSGHTMSSFALFTFFALCWKNKKWTGLLMISLASLVGISRIYLVQHFLIDVYVGAIMGVLIGIMFYYLQGFIGKDEKHWTNQRLNIRQFKTNKP